MSSTIPMIYEKIIIGSDRRPETKQGIEGKIVRFRSGRVGDRVMELEIRIADLNQIADLKLSILASVRRNSDRRSEPNTVLYEKWS